MMSYNGWYEDKYVISSNFRYFKYCVLIILTLFIATFSQFVKADGTWVNCNRTNGYYQYFDTTKIEVGKDAQVGDLLGTWITSSNPAAWACTPVSRYLSATPQMSVQGYPPYSIWQTKSVDGRSYSVYNTAVKTGLGYIARWRYTIKGTTSDWQPLTVAPGVYQDANSTVTVPNSDGAYNIGIDVQIRFVKTSTALTSGTTSIFDPMYLRHKQVSDGSSFNGAGSYMIAEFLAGGMIISTGGTCTTPNVSETLPDVSRSSLTHVGATGGQKYFDLKFQQCTAGLGSVSYSFAPTTTVVDATQGVVAPNSGSATGVGVQYMINDTTPVTFGSSYLLSTYDPTVDNGNYTVSMSALLYQTAAAVTPGTVTSSITFTTSYK